MCVSMLHTTHKHTSAVRWESPLRLLLERRGGHGMIVDISGTNSRLHIRTIIYRLRCTLWTLIFTDVAYTQQ